MDCSDDLILGFTAAARFLGVSKTRVHQLVRAADNPLGAFMLPPRTRLRGVDVYYGFSRSALEEYRIRTAVYRLRRKLR
jgi:hypothetical protein